MNKPQAIIYCRVSSKGQETDGHGLESQESRCRQYAKNNGYEVVSVFPDTKSGGGDFVQRPGMVALLSLIDAQPGEKFIVIFDDLKRLSRDTRAFLDLRDAFRLRGVQIESPNFSFEDTPEGEFVETVIAAQGALERKQNGRQVKQKMNVRTDLGFWCHLPPVGYRFEKVTNLGKTLVRDEPVASIVQEALEGYADGRFQTQAEVRRFLQNEPRFPRSKAGQVGAQRVSEMLRKTFYAGYLNSDAYGLSWHKMQHEPLISLETFEKIQNRLKGKARAPKRANIGDQFALRGVAVCACCKTPFRSSFSKGRNGTRHPYYLCQTKGCEVYGKSIRRDVLEGDVGALIKRLEPTAGLTTLVTEMFRTVWNARAAQAKDAARIMRQQIAGLEREITKTVDRIVETESQTVVRALENKIEDLERQKLLLADKAASQGQPKRTFEEQLEPAIACLTNPWKLWESGEITLRRLVLKLAFAEPVQYCRNRGARTPEFSLPFRALGGISGGEIQNGGA
ncbi:MAG: recombinase family protein [Pseudomonadota bacterium]